jgi:hypothetical protein
MLQYWDVAIKSYAISSLNDSTFDGFNDCTANIKVRVIKTGIKVICSKTKELRSLLVKSNSLIKNLI